LVGIIHSDVLFIGTDEIDFFDEIAKWISVNNSDILVVVMDWSISPE
jgi:hypothetical protein